MTFNIEQFEIGRSQEFFSDSQSYVAFDLDEQHRKILGCIDPRDQASTQLATIVQTPGGAVGVGLDHAIAERSISGSPVSIEDGMITGGHIHPSLKLGAHHQCKFIGGIPVVLDEMADPGDFTRNSAARWIDYYGFKDDITPRLLTRIGDAAEGLRNDEFDEVDLLASVSQLYEAKNVVTMSGDNTAAIYIVNHHSNVGLNRQKKHREAGIKVQAYHDSLGATIDNLAISRLTTEQRRYTLGAHIIKAAAVRTVIGSANTHYYEGLMTGRGLQIVEVESQY